MGTSFENINVTDLNIFDIQHFEIFGPEKQHTNEHYLLSLMGPKQSSNSIGLNKNGKYDGEILINL